MELKDNMIKLRYFKKLWESLTSIKLERCNMFVLLLHIQADVTAAMCSVAKTFFVLINSVRYLTAEQRVESEKYYSRRSEIPGVSC